MKRLTAADLMALKPCADYPIERVQELWASREALTPLDILELDIPPGDRIWVLCQPGVIKREVMLGVIAKIVDRAVRNHALPHPLTKEWAERWLSGEDRSLAGVQRAGHQITQWLEDEASQLNKYTTDEISAGH